MGLVKLNMKMVSILKEILKKENFKEKVNFIVLPENNIKAILSMDNIMETEHQFMMIDFMKVNSKTTKNTDLVLYTIQIKKSIKVGFIKIKKQELL